MNATENAIWGHGIVGVFLFFRQVLKNPLRTGAIAPSSRFLAERMVDELDLSGEPVVVELGAGTGALSKELLRRMGGHGRLILVERSETAARLLRSRFPSATVICDCVTNLGMHLRALGIHQVDYVVSGLPWTLFNQELQEQALAEIVGALRPGGTFVTFIYAHAGRLLRMGRRFEYRLRATVGDIDKSRVVWRNLPPARVWTARRMLPEGAGARA